MFIRLINSLKFILTRAVVLYLACFLLLWHMLDYHQLVNNAVPTTLSRMPLDVDYFNEFVDHEGRYDRFKLMDCVYYHKAVAHFFPFQRAEAYGMLGFCYERLGQEPLAVDSYQKAIVSNPDYFWPYYDLGVIFYKKAQYARAADYFQRAVEQNPVKTVVLLTRSKVYSDVRGSRHQGPYDLIQGIKEGRTQAYALLMDCLIRTDSYAPLGKIAINGLKEGAGPESVFYYYAGVAAFYQKFFPQAMAFLQAAVQGDPHNADAYYYLGLCLRVAGRDDMSRIFLARAASLHQQGDSGMVKQYLKPRVRFF